jgi:putative transposase
MTESVKMRTLFHCVYALAYHLVLVTKRRHKCINGPILCRLHEITEQCCKEWRGEMIEFNGEADHIHALISLPPNLDLSSFVNNLKTISSRLVQRDFGDHLNKIYRKPGFWSRSHCIISCSGAPLDALKHFVEQQSGSE